MERDAVSAVVAEVWQDEIVAQLESYIAVPALSPAFDADWEAAGHIDEAVGLVSAWIESRPVVGMTVEVQRLPGRTPLIVVEVEPVRRRSRGWRRRIDGGALRPSGQAATDVGVARRAGAVEAGAGGGASLRAGRCRRWLRRVRQPGCDRGGAGLRRQPQPLPGVDRGIRGVRQPRPDAPSRSPG